MAQRTAAPLGSVTVPITVPVVTVCAFAGCVIKENIRNIPAKKINTPVFFTFPPLFIFGNSRNSGERGTQTIQSKETPVTVNAMPKHSLAHSQLPPHANTQPLPLFTPLQP